VPRLLALSHDLVLGGEQAAAGVLTGMLQRRRIVEE
jgi:hypothetical protein